MITSKRSRPKAVNGYQIVGAPFARFDWMMENRHFASKHIDGVDINQIEIIPGDFGALLHPR